MEGLLELILFLAAVMELEMMIVLYWLALL